MGLFLRRGLFLIVPMPPRAASCTLRRHRSRARAVPGLQFHHFTISPFHHFTMLRLLSSCLRGIARSAP